MEDTDLRAKAREMGAATRENATVLKERINELGRLRSAAYARGALAEAHAYESALEELWEAWRLARAAARHPREIMRPARSRRAAPAR